MASTYTLISSQVLGSAAASVTFSSIPSTYKDLVLRISVRTNNAGDGDNTLLKINGLTSGYSYTSLFGDASTATSANASSTTSWSIRVDGNTSTSNTFSTNEIYIPNYSGSTYKPASGISSMENNVANPVYTFASAYLLSNTAAISSFVLTPQVGTNFLTNSSFYLYGI